MEHETTIRRMDERYWVKYKTLCSPEGVLIWFYSLREAIEYVELHGLQRNPGLRRLSVTGGNGVTSYEIQCA